MNMHPWQLDFLEIIHGKKPEELVITMAGRQMGKSTIAQQLQLYKRMMDDIYNRPVQDLILTEGRVNGARYHCVQPEGGNWQDMEAWCIQTFGNPGDMWESSDWCWPETARWLKNNRKFWFRNEADRTLFVMKWR